MKKYSYVAKDEFGKTVKGSLVADSEFDLSEKIRNLGFYLTTFKEVKGTKAGSVKIRKPKPQDLLTFTRHLATLIEAGIPLVEGLKNMASGIDDESFQTVVDEIRFKVEGGASLKETLDAYPGVFSPLYVAVVGAGEATGKLTYALESLSEYLEWNADLQAKIKEAATYPVILFCVMILVVVILMVKVVPVFEPVFRDAGVALPLPTQIVMGVSSIIRNFWYIFVFLPAILAIACKFVSADPKGKYHLDSFLLKLPLFGFLLKNIIISRFCSILALALKSGVNIISALKMGTEAMGNMRLQQTGVKIIDAVNMGEKIADSFEVSHEFPSLVVQMIRIGEESGSIVNNLEKVSAYYDKEIPRIIRKIFALFEPMMIVFMGAVVGGIALAVFLPMIQLAQLAGG